MGVARARDVLVKPSTPTRIVVRFGLVASAFGVGMAWPNAAIAQVIEPPPHRIDFKVSPNLPKCNDYDGFYGILINWVRVRSIVPSADRRLVVDIQRAPDGRKVVNVQVLDAEGVEIGRESHRYGATEECFKVLYWTAWDSTRLLQTTIAPPEEDPPMSVDKLVEEVEKKRRTPEKPQLSTETWPICVREPERPTPPVKPPQPPKAYRFVFGTGVVGGLTRNYLPGFRVGLEKSTGPLVVGLDTYLFPPLVGANSSVDKVPRISAKGEAYLGSLSLCMHRRPLLGCLVATGGVAGYSYDKPSVDNERFATSGQGGVFAMGLRTGVQMSLSRTWGLRFDVDAQVPLYRAPVLQLQPQNQSGMMMMLMGFISVVPGSF